MASNKSIEEYQNELQELRAQKEKYQLIADFTHDWEYWIDPKENMKYISPGCKSITGYPPQTFLTNPDLFYEIVHTEDRDSFKKYVQDSLQFTSIGQSHTFRIQTKSMNVKHCMVSHKAVYDGKGTYLGQRGSIRDVSKLTEVLNQMKSLSESKQYEEKAKNKYKEMVDERDIELSGFLIEVSEKNELLQFIKRKLEKLNLNDEKQVESIKSILSKINSEVKKHDHWDDFRKNFELSNPGFFERLSSKYPQLTNKDLKLCAYLRLQLNTKEIANLMNITPKSAEVSRVRLRKKLRLQRSEDLNIFIGRL